MESTCLSKHISGVDALLHKFFFNILFFFIIIFFSKAFVFFLFTYYLYRHLRSRILALFTRAE